MRSEISNLKSQILRLRLLRCVAVAAVLAMILSSLSADEPRPISVTEALPFGQRPVDYWGKESRDPIAALQRRIDRQELTLSFVERFGYLPAILQELDIPLESQLLAFSSQSPHRNMIRPERPRAVYFNDDVSVSWFPGAVLLEIAAHDPQKGTLFYTVVNREETPPEFYRSNSQTCLGCHHMPANPSWTGVAVPGHLLRSFLETDEAQQHPFGKIRSHALPLASRWKTWYVTGIAPQQRHLGNLSLPAHERLKEDDPTYHRVLPDLAADFDTARYPIDTSDVAAHLIFDHQMLGLNLLARLILEHQFQVRSNIEEMVIRYLLLVDETPLDKPIAGESKFAAKYRDRGPKTADGRSLYELDLETRLFRHRISPLVNCRMVQGFPAELKRSLFERLNAVLLGTEVIEGFSIPDTDRQATLGILQLTVEKWPKK